MGLAASEAVQRFFQAARAQAETAGALAEQMGAYLNRPPTKTAVNHWATGVDRPTAEAMIAAAMALRMSIDEYVGRAKGEDAHDEAHARLDDAVATLQHELAELRQVVGDVLEKGREEDADQGKTGEVS